MWYVATVGLQYWTDKDWRFEDVITKAECVT